VCPAGAQIKARYWSSFSSIDSYARIPSGLQESILLPTICMRLPGTVAAFLSKAITVETRPQKRTPAVCVNRSR
jgi:hypothetical protein